MAKGRIIDDDIKSVEELAALGAGPEKLPNDDKVWVKANAINKTLNQAITDGDIGGAGGEGGGELVSLSFLAESIDSFDKVPGGDTSLADISAGKTDPTLHSNSNKSFRLEYDAAKTVTGTAASMVLSAAPAFVVKVGDLLIVAGQQREILTLGTLNADGGSGSPFTVEAAFLADPAAAQATISQAVHTVDLNNFVGSGQAVSALISDSFNQALITYQDTETLDDVDADFGVTPHVAFSASVDGIAYLNNLSRQVDITDTELITNLPATGTGLFVRFFANKTSGAGFVNLLRMEFRWHREETADITTILDQCYGLVDNSAAAINCTIDNSGPKTRVLLGFTYAIGTNPAEPEGDIEVELNGKNIYRIPTLGQAFFTEIDEQTLELDQDYSSFPYTIVVKRSRGTLDNSDTNTARITDLEDWSVPTFQDYIVEQFMTPRTIAGSPPDGQFFSEIVGRKSLRDFSKNLGLEFGFKRIMTQDLFVIQDEFGPNNQVVAGVPNDPFNQIRFSGPWVVEATAEGAGLNSNFVAYTDPDFSIEITFHGTGLILLARNASVQLNFEVSVDGGAQSVNSDVGNGSAVLGARRTSPNVKFEVATGLSLGTHTVKIRGAAGSVAALRVYGFEILNDRTDLLINSGNSFIDTKLVQKLTSESISFDSDFESGVLGTKGGNVLVYKKLDGTIKKAITPTDVGGSLFLGAADHTNEQAIREGGHYWREFGSGRTDDFSTLQDATTDRAFTLADNLHTLIGEDLRQFDGEGDKLRPEQATSFYIYTFYGTGVDFAYAANSTGTNGATDYEIYIDGILVGNLQTVGVDSQTRTDTLASGLPLGTHTVRIQRAAAGVWIPQAERFIPYGPKLPLLPVAAMKLGSYFLNADFVANTVSGRDTISTGTVRHHPVREADFINGSGGTTDWGFVFNVLNRTGGFGNQTDRLNAKIKIRFFGTGFDFRFVGSTNGTTDTTVTLDGLTFNTANFPTETAAATVYGAGVTFTPATGSLDEGTGSTIAGCGFIVSGLSLGFHTVEFNNNVASENLRFDAFDAITPIYSPQEIEPAMVDSEAILGSTALLDDRNFSPVVLDDVDVPNSVIIDPRDTATVSTTSIVFVPVPGMSGIIKMKRDGRLFIDVNILIGGSIPASQNLYLAFFVDGAQVGPNIRESQSGPNNSRTIATRTEILNLSKGIHILQLFWRVDSGTIENQLGLRKIAAFELK